MLRAEPVIGPAGLATAQVPGGAMAPVAGARRSDGAREHLALPARRRRGPVLWLVLALSALVHAMILAVLLLEPPTPPVEDGLGAPSVSVMLTPETPASPTPTPEAALGEKDAPTVQRDRAPDAVSAPAPAESGPVPPPPSPETTETAAIPAPPAPPAVNAPAPPAPRPSAVAEATAPPATRLLPPSAPAPMLPRVVPPSPPSPPPPQLPPQPPVREALVQPPRPPRPIEPAPPVPATRTAPATPAPPRPFVPTRPAPRQPDTPGAFPRPMISSLGGAFGESPARPSAPSREMPGPVRASSSSAFRPQYDLSGDDLGPGWERQFADWVNAHKFYPREAAENGEEGDAAVKLVINRGGQVIGVTLLQRSGSQWLDEALEALFRAKRLPPLPDSYGEGTATENVLMHYILIRR